MSIKDYYEKLNKFLHNENRIILEIEKCCNYSEFISVYKKDTFIDVMNNICKNFEINNFYENGIKLYAKNNDGCKLHIPIQTNTNIYDYIMINKDYFTPVYSLPAIVVYKLYYQDNLCNTHNCDHNIV